MLSQKNTIVIGYKNHAERIIKILLKKSFFQKLYIYHPVLSKLEIVKKIDKRIVITDNLDDVIHCNSVFISSPSETHVFYIKKILKIFSKSKIIPYIYCEKPLAVTKEEIEWLNNNKSSLHKKVFVGFNMIFSDFAKIVKDCIKNERLGRPIFGNFHISHGLAFKKNIKDNWRFQNTNLFSNILGNLGVHYIHLCNDFFGKIVECNVSSYSVKKFKNIDTTLIHLKSDKGVLNSIFLSYSTIYSNHFELYFTNGSIQFLDGLLLEVGPRDYFDELGNFAAPPKKIILQNQNKEDNSLERSLDFFIQTSSDQNFFKPNLFDMALKASGTILSF